MFENQILLKANATALQCIAKQMLYMAENTLPEGSHVHYDDFFTSGSTNELELIVEKI